VTFQQMSPQVELRHLKDVSLHILCTSESKDRFPGLWKCKIWHWPELEYNLVQHS
jgi:hypothetical protein